jgi:hypothetical protein
LVLKRELFGFAWFESGVYMKRPRAAAKRIAGSSLWKASTSRTQWATQQRAGGIQERNQKKKSICQQC